MAERQDAAETRSRSGPALMRLWLVLLLSYATLKVVFNAVFLGWIDLRPAFFWEVAVLPLGQSLVVWLVARGSRRATIASAAGEV